MKNNTLGLQLLKRLGHHIKITTKGDLKLAEQILKVLPKPKLDVAKHPFGDDDLWR